jgi:formylglycine-generating enzyme required for sulfatase activity
MRDRDRARDFCTWLNEEHADELPVRSDMKLIFRLPTEAEWEKAARGEKDWSWPWGDKFSKEKCNSIEGGILTTTRVGQYSPKGGDSPYGAADMVGNVWEWTNTRYARYPYKSGDGRERYQGKGQACVVRGGCYRDAQHYARIPYRYPILNASLYYFQGFRVVVAPPVSSIR